MAVLISPHSDDLAKQLYQASLCGRDEEVLKLLQRGVRPNSDYYTLESRMGAVHYTGHVVNLTTIAAVQNYSSSLEPL